MTLPREVRELLALDEELGEELLDCRLRNNGSPSPMTLEERALEPDCSSRKSAWSRITPSRSTAGRSDFVSTPRPTPGRSHPAFFHIHGGGFMLGSIDWVFNDAKCAHICASTRAVWLRRSSTGSHRNTRSRRRPRTATQLSSGSSITPTSSDIDPTRIAVGGESAGGNLAAVVALMSSRSRRAAARRSRCSRCRSPT